MTKSELARATLLSAVAAGLLTACVESVVLGGEGEQAADGGGGSGGSEGTSPGAPEVAAPGDGTTSTSTSTSASTGGGTPPALTATLRRNSPEVEAWLCTHYAPCDVPDETLFLVIDPVGPVCGGIEDDVDPWRMIYTLLPERQVVGSYEVEGPGSLEYYWGMWVSPGPLEILAIDGDAMTIRFELHPNDEDPLLGQTLTTQSCDDP